MAIRGDVWIDWDASPRLIWVRAPSTNILVQDIVDTLRTLEADQINLAYPKLIEASGKAYLYSDSTSDYYTGIVLRLLNAQIAFEARPGPDYIQCSITGGDIVSQDDLGDNINPVYPTSFTQILIATSTSPTLVTTTSGDGVGTVEQVRDAVWNAPIANHIVSGSFGHFMQKKVLTIAKYLGLK